MAAACALSANAQDLEAGDYYLRNVESGKYVAWGANWGTRSVLTEHGALLRVTLADGQYTLKNCSGNTNYGKAIRPSDGFADQSGTWTVTPVGDGTYTVKGSNGYYRYDGSALPAVNGQEGQTGIYWEFLSKDELTSRMASATVSAPADATHFIASPDFLNNDYGFVSGKAWGVNIPMSNGQPHVTAMAGSGNTIINNTNCEIWSNTNSNIKQTLTGLPKGTYKLSCYGLYRDGGPADAATNRTNDTETLRAFLYAGDAEVALMSIFEYAGAHGIAGTSTSFGNAPNSNEQAALHFAEGDYLNTLLFEVTEDGGSVTIGIRKDEMVGNDWAVFDNFDLKYYGTATIAEVENASLVEEYRAVYSAVSAIDKTAAMNSAVLAALTNALSDYAEATVLGAGANAESIQAATDALKEAKTNAENSVKVYANVAAALAQKTPDAAAFAALVADQQAAYDNATITDGVAELAAINAAYNRLWRTVYATIEPGDYLLQNIETGKYLGAANAWGTQASLLTRGILWNVEAVADGKYSLDSHIANSAAQHYLTGTYTDGNATGFALIAVGDGYALTADNENFLTTPDNNIVDLSAKEMAGKAIWKLISKEDLYAQMTAATEEAPVDATVLVKDANFSRNNTGYDAWVWKFANAGNTNHAKGGDNANCNVESYHTGFEVAQAVNVPNGRYLVTAQGFYRQDGSDNDHLPYFFANDQKANVLEKTGTENSMAEASASFNNGLYKIAAMEVEVTDGILNIGVSNMENDALWVIFDNFEITCLGMAQSSVDVVANEWGTFVAPFEVAVPSGVKAYTVDGVTDNVLTLTEVTTAIAANTPVVLEGTCNETAYGFAFAETAVKGLLTGVYADTEAPVGSYVMQNQSGVIGFYQVGEEVKPTVRANRAYLTAPAAGVKAFTLGEATAIETIEALTSGKAQIFDLNGRQINSLQKGINIVNGKKIMVK